MLASLARLLTLLAVTATATPDAPHAFSAADLTAFVDETVQGQLTKLNIAGAVVTIVKDGAVVLTKGYGFADIAAGRRMTADGSLVRPGSISKLFTGIAVMQLVEQGKLDLDHDVNDYLDFHVPTPAGGVPVTLRRLLTHRAGFEEHIKGVVTRAPVPVPLGPWLARAQPKRIFPGGDVSAYSNYGVSLAGYIVERVAGVTFTDYMTNHILRPLGMTRSTFAQPLPGALAPLAARGYRQSDQPPLPFTETIQTIPAGALAATGADMGRFMLALLAGGTLDGARVLTAQSLAAMTGRQVVTRTGSMGLAFFETRLRSADDDTGERERYYGHDGGTVTFFSDLLLAPQHQLGVFTSYDGTGGAGISADLARAVIRRYFPASSTAPAPPQPPAAPVEDLASLTGAYEPSRRAESTFARLGSIESQILIRRRADGTLTMQPALWPFGDGAPLLHVGPGLFVDPRGQGRRLAFERAPNGSRRLDIGVPAMEWQPVAWYVDARFVLATVPVGLAVAALTLVAWPFEILVRARRRRRSGAPPAEDRAMRSARVAIRLVAALQVGLLIAVVALYVAANADITMLGDDLDPVLVVMSIGAWLATLGSLLAIWIAWRFWRRRAGSLWTRLHQTLLAASTLAMAWFFVAWHIAATTLNY
jgi:CubicO group peptidase (beta-lactamase class C family)